MRIFSSISDPVCEILDFDQRINGDDRGLINAWNVGRNLALRNPDLVRRMMDGELPVLGVKGGVREKIQADKIGIWLSGKDCWARILILICLLRSRWFALGLV